MAANGNPREQVFMRRTILVTLLLVATAQSPAAGPGPSMDALASTSTGASAELRGLFQYLADAPLFTDCRTRRSYPVAMEQGYSGLERAYLAARGRPGEPMLATLRGRLLPRPAMEGSSPVETLVVETFADLQPGRDCGTEAEVPLTGTRWRLIALDGSPISVKSKRRIPHLQINAATRSVGGYSGCNPFSGNYTQTGDALGFGTLSGTLRACPAEAAMEQGFFDALKRTDRFRIWSRVLELYQGDALLARFRAESTPR